MIRGDCKGVVQTLGWLTAACISCGLGDVGFSVEVLFMSVMLLGIAAKGGRAAAMTSPPSLSENLQSALCIFV